MKSRLPLIIFFGILLIITLGYLLKKAIQPTAKQSETISMMTVQVTPVKVQPFSKIVSAYGVISTSPQTNLNVSTIVPVMIGQVYVTIGQSVKKNQPLFSVMPTSDTLLAVTNAKAAYNYAQSEVQRLKTMRDKYLATNADVTAAEQTFLQDKINLSNVIAAQKLSTGDIKASENGVVLSINVQPNQIVAANTTLLLLGNSNYLVAQLALEIKDLKKIKLGDRVKLFNLYDETISTSGTVDKITSQIDPKSGAVPIFVGLHSTNNLLPGTDVRGDIYFIDHKPMLVVPYAAVLSQDNNHYIFVIKNSRAIKRNVQIFGEMHGMIAISKGISEGELVVIIGNYELQNGMAVKIKDVK